MGKARYGSESHLIVGITQVGAHRVHGVVREKVDTKQYSSLIQFCVSIYSCGIHSLNARVPHGHGLVAGP